MSSAGSAVFLSLVLLPASAAAQPVTPDPAPARLHRTLSSGALRFEVNQGQADSRVHFIARRRDYQLFLTGSEATFRFSPDPTTDREAVLRLLLVGARTPRTIAGEQPLAGVTNYLKGPEREWKTGIPSFAQVRYTDLYEGIDLVYYGSERQLEYDFIVAPGADASRISMRFSGASRPRLARSGELTLRVGGRQLRQAQPVAFQDIAGVRREVRAAYRVARDGSVGFSIGPYDRALPLTIDPVLIYSTYLGGTDEQAGVQDVAVDDNGATYVSGTTTSIDFPTTPGALRGVNNGGGMGCDFCDGFVTKFDASGTLVYSTFIGGHGSHRVTKTIVDRWGAAYVAGVTYATDLATTPGAFQRTCVPIPTGVEPGCRASYVAKLDPSGSRLSFATYLGGAGVSITGYGTYVNAIALDDALNIYLTGVTSQAFPVTAGAFQTQYQGNYVTGFVAKMNAAGSGLIYASYLGGSKGSASLVSDEVTDIAVDGSANAYVTGVARTTDFPTTPGAYLRTCRTVADIGGCEIAFVTKINQTGSALLYSTFLGGSGPRFPSGLDGSSSVGSDVAVDRHGFAYVSGNAYTADFPITPGSYRTVATVDDRFVTKLDQQGSGLVYSTFLGTTPRGPHVPLAIDAEGGAYVAASATAGQIPPFDAVQPTYGGGETDSFVARLNPGGSDLTFATYLGGSDTELVEAIALDAFGAIHVAGITLSTNFPVVNAAQPVFPDVPGNQTSYVSRIGEPPTCGVDVTPQIQLFQSGFIPLFWPFTLQLVVVKNNAATPLNGVMAYVMDDLRSAVYAGSSAQTGCFSPEGDPLKLVPLGDDNVLAPNDTVLMGLWFYQTQLAPISYTPRVLAGYRR